MFRLRRDVHFADGTPLTSADVVFSLRRLVNLKGNPSHLLAGFSVSAKDEYAVILESSTPQPAVAGDPHQPLDRRRQLEARPGARGHGRRRCSTADKAEALVRTRPPRLERAAGRTSSHRITRHRRSRFAPNPSYWGARKPAFAAVVIRNMAAPVQLAQHPARRPSDRPRPLVRPGRDARGRPRPARDAPALAVGLLRLHATPTRRSRRSRPTASSSEAVRYALDYKATRLRRGARGDPGPRADPVDDPRCPAAEGRTEAGPREGQGRLLAASGVGGRAR